MAAALVGEVEGYRVQYGQYPYAPGYTVNAPEGDIPLRLERSLQLALGPSWVVDDRGSRLEVTSRRPRRLRDDQAFMQAMTAALAK